VPELAAFVRRAVAGGGFGDEEDDDGFAAEDDNGGSVGYGGGGRMGFSHSHTTPSLYVLVLLQPGLHR